jgi:hypothetical protein
VTAPALVSRSKHARIGLYGDPGVGKTRLIGTSPGRVLIIRPPTDHTDSMLPADRARVKELVISDWDGMMEVLERLRHEGDQWDWVWLDSISLMQDHLLDDIWETTIAEKPHRARYGLDKQEYGINFMRLGIWMRHMVGPDLFNFGFTAHTAELLPSEDPEAEKKLMPWVQGKNMSPKFCGYMNVVAFMDQAKIGGKADRRVLRLNSSERYFAKDQFDMTEDGRIVDPTMVKVSELIDESRARAAAATPVRRRRRRPATTK